MAAVGKWVVDAFAGLEGSTFSIVSRLALRGIKALTSCTAVPGTLVYPSVYHTLTPLRQR